MTRPRGFTLLEVLLVVVILAILAGLIGLAVGGNPHKELEREAKRLVSVLTAASEESIQRSVQLGLFSDSETYSVRWYSTEDQTWQPLSDAKRSEHSLPDSIEMEARAEQRTTAALGNDENQPLVILLSSGELTPFELVFRHSAVPDAGYLVSSDGFSGIFSRPLP